MGVIGLEKCGEIEIVMMDPGIKRRIVRTLGGDSQWKGGGVNVFGVVVEWGQRIVGIRILD